MPPRLILKPLILPQSFSDGALAAAVGALQFLVFVLPGALALATFENNLPGIVLLVAVPLFFNLHCISQTSVDTDGIHFKRVLGAPRTILWSEITSVHAVSSRELVVNGWLWPLFPAREMTPSLTTLGHYRIQFGTRWVYFPPKEPEKLLEYVRRNAGDA
jgi:hypothetical protein